MRRLFLAVVLIAFAVNEMNAQRRTNNNNRTKTTRAIQKKHNGFVRTVRPRNQVRTRVIPRVNRFNRGFRGSGRLYYNNFYNRPFNARGFYVPFRTHANLFPLYNNNTLESVEAQQEALENIYEVIRAKRLAKFINRPNKRNKKRLVKYNILTGREADDITP